MWGGDPELRLGSLELLYMCRSSPPGTWEYFMLTSAHFVSIKEGLSLGLSAYINIPDPTPTRMYNSRFFWGWDHWHNASLTLTALFLSTLTALFLFLIPGLHVRQSSIRSWKPAELGPAENHDNISRTAACDTQSNVTWPIRHVTRAGCSQLTGQKLVWSAHKRAPNWLTIGPHGAVNWPGWSAGLDQSEHSMLTTWLGEPIGWLGFHARDQSEPVRRPGF